jgi:hypothetical protein
VLCFEDWLDENEHTVHNDKDSFYLYPDGSFRICAAFGWTLRDSSDQEIDSGSGSIGPFCTVFDREVAAIENEITAVLRCGQPFKPCHSSFRFNSCNCMSTVHYTRSRPIISCESHQACQAVAQPRKDPLNRLDQES